MRQLDNWLTSYLEYVDESEPPTLYKKWAAVSCIASCLQRKCYLQWDTEVYPNLFIVLVGPSGARKGTALGPTRRFLNELGVKLAADSLTREALIEQLTESNSLYLLGDGVEKYHSSITVFSPELAVFIRQGDRDLVLALTDWYDCRDPWVYQTKGRGEEIIDALWVNLIGAITPDLLKTTLPRDAIGGGLVSRIIFVYGDTKSKTVPYPIPNPELLELQGKLLSDLELIYMMQGEFKPTEEYIKRYVRWYESHENIPIARDFNLESYIARRSLHLRKVSIVMSAARGSDMTINEEDFENALELLEETERLMPRVFLSYGRYEFADLYPRIEGLLKVSKRMTFGEILERFYKEITKDELKTIIETLADRDICKTERIVEDGKNLPTHYIVYTGD